MNGEDMLLYAEDKGVEDGLRRDWSPPFRREIFDEGVRAYSDAWWLAFCHKVIEEEFPNDEINYDT